MTRSATPRSSPGGLWTAASSVNSSRTSGDTARMLRGGPETHYSYCRSSGKLLYLGRTMGGSEPLIQASLRGEAVEHGPAAVFVADEHGRYVAVNQAACKLVGYEREELL